MQVNDAKFAALRVQGFTGSTSEMTLQWLHANGASSDHMSDAWLEMLAANGFPNTTITDGWFDLLRNLGYTGAASDMQLDFWLGGGTFPP